MVIVSSNEDFLRNCIGGRRSERGFKVQLDPVLSVPPDLNPDRIFLCPRCILPRAPLPFFEILHKSAVDLLLRLAARQCGLLQAVIATEVILLLLKDDFCDVLPPDPIDAAHARGVVLGQLVALEHVHAGARHVG